MKKLVFFTDSGFWSHKPDLLVQLNQQYYLRVVVFLIEGFKNHSEENIVRFCDEENIHCITVHLKYRARSLKNFRYFYIKIFRTIISKNTDIIYAESFGSPYFLVLLRIFAIKNNVVIGIHDFKLHEIEKKRVSLSAKVYQYLYLKLFTKFHFFSYKQEELFRKKFPDKDTYVVRLALVGTDYFNDKSVSKEKNRFLFFGRIQYYKGVDILIEAINILSNRRNDFMVIIAGKTDKEKYYHSLLTDRAKGNVKLNLGFIPNKEIPNLYIKSTFFIAPYREVTQSGPLMMAYNYGLIPIVSNDRGFLEYVDDDINGFVFENESASSLADVMDKVCSFSDEKLNSVTESVESFISHEFNPVLIGKRYKKMFDKLVFD